MQYTFLEAVFDWLHRHPWGWLLVLLLGVLFLIQWIAEPIDWRNSEGTLRDEKLERQAKRVWWFR